MRPKDFGKSASGRLERSKLGHWTFVPNPLPPALEYAPPLVNRIVSAERALGELAGVGQLLSNAYLLIGPFLRREAVLSSKIEGTVTRLDELMLFEVQPDHPVADTEDRREVLNYVQALDHGLRRLKELPLCLRLLREVHEKLMTGVRGSEKRPGRFRDCPVVIGREGQSYDEARFVPPAAEHLTELLKDYEKFLNKPGELPVVVQLALAHYQFEAIHPFMDGNGRIGRLLITLMLCERKCLPQPLLYLSAYLERHDDEYKDHLLRVSQNGTWTEWIDFFARGIEEQSRDAANRARRLLNLQQAYRERLQKVSVSSNVLLIADHLLQSPYVTIPLMQKLLGVTHRAASMNVAKLLEQGILQETDPTRKSSRVFHAPEVLALLNADRVDPPEVSSESPS